MSSDKYYKELQSLKYFDEEKLIEKIINESNWLNDEEISINAESIVEKCRSDRNKTKLDNFFLEYGLSNQEGVALMCLAESLLRIPDNSTCDEIIEEKIGGKSWLNHLNNSPNKFHIKITIMSDELRSIKKIDSTKRIYKILENELS